MPWKECSVVEERLRFVARLLDGEAMTELCREFAEVRYTIPPNDKRLFFLRFLPKTGVTMEGSRWE
jgi:hypothetical protein